jgi:hypothetical protein
LVEARCGEIHDEWIRNLCANDPKIPESHLRAARDLMNAVLPSATVTDYEAIIPSIKLPMRMTGTWSQRPWPPARR